MLHYVYKIKMEKIRVIKLQISIELSNCLKWLICKLQRLFRECECKIVENVIAPGGIRVKQTDAMLS